MFGPPCHQCGSEVNWLPGKDGEQCLCGWPQPTTKNQEQITLNPTQKIDYKAESIRWKYLAESRAKTLEAWGVGEVVSVSELRAKIEALPPRQDGEDMRNDILNCLPNVRPPSSDL